MVTSAIVCRSMWKACGSGSTAFPAIVMSESGCSHNGVSCKQREILDFSPFRAQNY